MTFFEFLISIQGIIGVIIGFILRGLREKGEVYAFLHDDKVNINPKGDRLDDKGKSYVNINNVDDAFCGGGALNIEILNDARLPKKVIIDKIKFSWRNKIIIGEVINIEVKGKDYNGDNFISLDSKESKKGKFYIEITKEDLKKIDNDKIYPNRLVGFDSRRNKVYIKVY
ncbi:hypothetical protein HSACCH_02433 [Halanaerobium saccharolyticum subsp. saccharolyticum DSM 6643]|uniref:Uncharacterized protein n=1 Tax=Halanaerobium saccharolyticum subsp. saccharolyticum DSM 6643 TaxID=1293054 RepID=M5E3Z2_9FIRM|nr:hypothetical protein [Halanaerobium saccharolyticum]CCU80931.1 hypothetical protein HSACCH_02433 [Halanaerobium saccharolyticum subsp. saccharolyticum DSM 6643]